MSAGPWLAFSFSFGRRPQFIGKPQPEWVFSDKPDWECCHRHMKVFIYVILKSVRFIVKINKHIS